MFSIRRKRFQNADYVCVIPNSEKKIIIRNMPSLSPVFTLVENRSMRYDTGASVDVVLDTFVYICIFGTGISDYFSIAIRIGGSDYLTIFIYIIAWSK